MAAKDTTLNAANLARLGAERLAALLMDLAEGDANTKRRLRLELVAVASPRDLAKEIRKRLTSLGKARGFVDWNKHRALAEDLDTQRRAIVETLAAADPAGALDLLWAFLALAEPTINRCDDSNGTIGAIFQQACADLGPLAVRVAPQPAGLAEQVFAALRQPDYGQYDGLIATLAPALGADGLTALKQRVEAWSREPMPRPADKDRVKVGWSPNGPIYADELESSGREMTVRMALTAIADALGDVDAFIAQYDAKARTMPGIAAQIAPRLIAAGRAGEALAIVDGVAKPPASLRGMGGPWIEVDDARIAALEALGRKDDAQAVRRACFEWHLSARHLRDYLKRLPDFDDMEAEEKALTWVQGQDNWLLALYFLTHWPALDRAAALVLDRADDLNGDAYEVCSPAAEALAEHHPLAATLLWRAMIDFALDKGRTGRYKHAARHLEQCAAVAPRIADFGRFPPHATYEAGLRRDHGRKSSFWGA